MGKRERSQQQPEPEEGAGPLPTIKRRRLQVMEEGSTLGASSGSSFHGLPPGGGVGGARAGVMRKRGAAELDEETAPAPADAETKADTKNAEEVKAAAAAVEAPQEGQWAVRYAGGGQVRYAGGGSGCAVTH